MFRAFTLSFGLFLTTVTTASAFCGFYVSRADGDLYNQASKVVFTRVNDSSVITMSSDYRGPTSEFAMIVPTPSTLDRSQVRTVPSKTVDHLDGYTAPRLVEYFDGDPCNIAVEEPMVVEAASSGATTQQQRRDGARALGVKILREYAVGSYDIQMLSAKRSNGLVTFLKSEGYKLPDGAEAALGSYIDMGMKFFVAKVNLARHSTEKAQELEPLQISFRSRDFMLPIQLGKVNADGPQDLIVLMLSRKGMVKLKNYTTKDIPTGQNIPVFVKDVFPQFYRAMIKKLAPESGAFLEYAWDMAWCDPCSDDPLTLEEFRQLGVGWLSKATASTPNVFVTRLHIRYSKTSFFEDLKFTDTDIRENFQGTYVLNHPFEGEIKCDTAYIAETRQRIKDEAKLVQSLTGWTNKQINPRIAKSVQARYR
jgi:hypothetical protein